MRLVNLVNLVRAAKAAGAAVAAIAIALVLAVPVLAASPDPTPGIGDPRSTGAGPGLVGDPLTAIAVVAAIGLVTLVATLLYVRATSPGRTPDR